MRQVVGGFEGKASVDGGMKRLMVTPSVCRDLSVGTGDVCCSDVVGHGTACLPFCALHQQLVKRPAVRHGRSWSTTPGQMERPPDCPPLRHRVVDG